MTRAAEMLRYLFETFPPLDPASEFYGEDVNGADVVNFLSENAEEIREIIDQEEEADKKPAPISAIILDGGLVQCVVSNRPELFTGELLVIDYDEPGEDAIDIPQGDGTISRAYVHGENVTEAAIDLAATLKNLEESE